MSFFVFLSKRQPSVSLSSLLVPGRLRVRASTAGTSSPGAAAAFVHSLEPPADEASSARTRAPFLPRGYLSARVPRPSGPCIIAKPYDKALGIRGTRRAAAVRRAL